MAHTHPFNGPFSRTTRVSRYQKGKTNLNFTEARDSEWQWHQLGHMQVCTSLQTDNHASIPPLSFFYRPDALPAAQPTASKHWQNYGTMAKRAKTKLRTLTTWHCPHSPAAAAVRLQSIDISCLLGSQQQTGSSGVRRPDGRTDECKTVSTTLGPDLQNILRLS